MNPIQRMFRAIVFVVMAFAAFVAQAGTITYYHNDLLGSPAVATNASGQVVWRESYRPYGERLTNDPASSGNDVWFTSRRQDADTGLVYMGARYYDPTIGRFISTDPKLFNEANVHSFNRYAYANDNPYRFVDPDGRAAEDVFPKGSAVVAAGRAMGAVAAYVEGIATNNSALAATAVQGMAEERQQNVDALLLLGSIGRSGRPPSAGGGAQIENISTGDAVRIQNAVDRTGIEVTVVGSRAQGTAKPNSDWDYILSGGSRSEQRSIKSSLPEGPRGIGEPRSQDFHHGPVDESKPYIRFSPGE